MSALFTTVPGRCMKCTWRVAVSSVDLEEEEAVGGRLKGAVISRIAPILPVKETAFMPREEQSSSAPIRSLQIPVLPLSELCEIRYQGPSVITLQNTYILSLPGQCSKHGHRLSPQHPIHLGQGTATLARRGPTAWETRQVV